MNEGTIFNQKQMLHPYRSNEFKSCHDNQFYIMVLESLVALYEMVLRRFHLSSASVICTCFVGSVTDDTLGSVMKSLWNRIRKVQTLNKCSHWFNKVTWCIYWICVVQYVYVCKRQTDTEKDRYMSCFWVFLVAVFYFPWLGVSLFEHHKGSPLLADTRLLRGKANICLLSQAFTCLLLPNKLR